MALLALEVMALSYTKLDNVTHYSKGEWRRANVGLQRDIARERLYSEESMGHARTKASRVGKALDRPCIRSE